ncbi:Nif3-like dinuclear metal center hexameric protein [Ulvibacterium marinum]|uniref:Nif3-like dinuclear metal center hexameric protein n=1 Tax=Ulvibacterium marinum TaxID=2419782 RepID=UPI00249487D1|nr:Nif3-like dinuclear metal center hexameric protein [Ulvibacterium marinum]
MTILEITQILEELAPLHYAEDFDNTGILVGNPETEVSGVLVTLDTLETVIEEAIAHNCNLIVSFHPIIFGGLKKLTGSSYVERTVTKAIQNQIAIYSMHTALDNSPKGVNAKICEILGIQNPKILIPKKGTLKKLTTYVPKNDAEKVRKSLFAAGAGNIGKYSDCSFNTDGTGSYKANDGANPAKGQIGQIHYEEETQINVVFSAMNEPRIKTALLKHHPYEEVAYEIHTLDNTDPAIGMGMVGHLKNPMEEMQFLELIKKKMKASCIRHSELLGKRIQKVAVLGGSGAFAISAAKASGADVFITADVKYHQFYEAENRMIIADIGHYETEQFTKNLLVDYLTKKIPNFAIRLSESKTNPIKYL